MNKSMWTPLAPDTLGKIKHLFARMLPESDYGGLAAEITGYWTRMLESVWTNKDARIKEKDLEFDPGDPLSRIQRKTVVIAYPDSVREGGGPTLAVLDRFLTKYFPAAGGLHVLPACRIVKDRFNDGYFSQVERNRIDPAFGTNDLFAGLAGRYYFMADFVLNHVDIVHPKFCAYLDGNDAAGECFYLFSEKEYQQHLNKGDFDLIFRPRSFPLFTIFRRRPENPSYDRLDQGGRIMAMDDLLPYPLALPIIGIFTIFTKIRNDQMLLEADYRLLEEFRRYLEANRISPEAIFTISSIQETRHPPYIFKPHIRTRADLLRAIGYESGRANQLAGVYETLEGEVFGEPVRALTTFSHVQVDMNTSTLAGLKLLADDFSWYLGLDLNMLRLDAANYAFKKWGTSCFGLPEIRCLMRILYLSMECVSPRITANLEVNDTLGSVLAQLAAPDAPPMMYDFHLAGLLPAVFNLGNATILDRIQEKIEQFDISHNRIRFSVAESHDGKSVRGSLDLLDASERRRLAGVVLQNNGRIKYKSAPARQTGRDKGADGREPYELCISTRDALIRLEDRQLEIARYLAFYTLAFALTGRNIRTLYFNDLMGLGNDVSRMEATGELRDIKRTRSEYADLAAAIRDPSTFSHAVSAGINRLVALADHDRALHFRGHEARTFSAGKAAVMVYNHYQNNWSLALINIAGRSTRVNIKLTKMGTPEKGRLFENLEEQWIHLPSPGGLELELTPFQRLWLTESPLVNP